MGKKKEKFVQDVDLLISEPNLFTEKKSEIFGTHKKYNTQDESRELILNCIKARKWTSQWRNTLGTSVGRVFVFVVFVRYVTELLTTQYHHCKYCLWFHACESFLYTRSWGFLWLGDVKWRWFFFLQNDPSWRVRTACSEWLSNIVLSYPPRKHFPVTYEIFCPIFLTFSEYPSLFQLRTVTFQHCLNRWVGFYFISPHNESFKSYYQCWKILIILPKWVYVKPAVFLNYSLYVILNHFGCSQNTCMLRIHKYLWHKIYIYIIFNHILIFQI